MLVRLDRGEACSADIRGNLLNVSYSGDDRRDIWRDCFRGEIEGRVFEDSINGSSVREWTSSSSVIGDGFGCGTTDIGLDCISDAGTGRYPPFCELDGSDAVLEYLDAAIVKGRAVDGRS